MTLEVFQLFVALANSKSQTESRSPWNVLLKNSGAQGRRSTDRSPCLLWEVEWFGWEMSPIDLGYLSTCPQLVVLLRTRRHRLAGGVVWGVGFEIL